MPAPALERKLIRAIRSHATFPTIDSVASTSNVHPKRVQQARNKNPKIREAWKQKNLQLIKKLNPKQLFSHRATSICIAIPEAREHRQRVIFQRIRSFNGRPSLLGLASHVTGSTNANIKFLLRSPEVRRVAIAKVITLLRRTPDSKIRRLQVDRHTVPEVARYLDKRLGRK
ncbi:MAG: hypothetical protein Q8R15_04475 [Candidatus Micrarchaeota archaeon]|nr:hypothetical protein [Candidatus Micrarchaeota archaeon]